MLGRSVVFAVAMVGLTALPAAAQQYPPAQHTMVLGNSGNMRPPCPGGYVGIRAQTFAPESLVSVFLVDADGGRTEIFTFLPRLPWVDSNGLIGFEAEIPQSTPLGPATLQLVGVQADGSPLELSAAFEVVACDAAPPPTSAPEPGAGAGGGQLPRTGAGHIGLLLRAGLALAALGGVLVAATARRRHARQAVTPA